MKKTIKEIMQEIDITTKLVNKAEIEKDLLEELHYKYPTNKDIEKEYNFATGHYYSVLRKYDLAIAALDNR